MSCDSENKNEYTFIWVIENFWSYINNPLFLESGKKSPIFTVEFSSQTSWVLTVYVKKCWPYRNQIWIGCSLVRDTAAEGKETVEINCNIKLRIGNTNICVDERLTNNVFKKGDFCEYVFKFEGNKHYMILPMTIQCHMLENLPMIKSVSASKTIRSLAGSLQWLKVVLADKKTFSCPGEARIEFSFYTSNKQIGIKMSRTDKANNIMCYIMLSVTVSTGNEEFDPIMSGNSPKPLGVNYTIEIPIFNETHLNSWFIKSIRMVSLKFICSVSAIQEENASGILSSDLLRNDNVLCNVICPDATTQKNNVCSKTNSDAKANDDLQNDFLRMYLNKIHSDMYLQVGNKSFPVHKCVLSTRSPMLAAMFNHEMAESQNGVVKITDVDAETLDLLLKFMYTGTASVLNYESALKLLLAADKYQMLSLKEICSDYLVSALSVSNVCEILNIADMICDNNLKVSSINYVKVHADKVLLSDKWKQLVDKNMALVSETLKNVSIDFGRAASK